jgi:DNA (cytosine-5)-methyltransferase 1
MSKSSFTLVDMFAGAGGLSCGLSMAGYEAILANEIVPEYANTYRENHPHTKLLVDDIRHLVESDIRKISKLKKGELDLLAGGPPCQGFSVNAPIRTLDDQRNHLFRDFLRVAEELKPKAILIENVPGMISLGRGTVVEQIHKELQRLGYAVDHRILFAGHYGVPQMRFRTVFIAIRNPKAKITFPEPRHDSKAVANFAGGKNLTIPILELFRHTLLPQTTVGEAIGDLPLLEHGHRIEEQDYSTPPSNWYQNYLRQGSTQVFNHYCARLAPINHERMKHIPQGGSWRDIPFDLLPAGLQRARRTDHTKRYGRLHPDALCSTVLTKCDPHWGSFFHPTQERVISVREAARIQSFPDVYRFTGSITDQYAQVGNAVPPLMSKAVGEQIKNLVEEYVTR